MRKQYSGTAEDFEKKLGRVMERLGVEKYQCDWTQGRGGSSCWVEMHYGGSVYRFENSTAKSAACGRGLTYASDPFAAVVYSLEGLARAVEQGIFTLDMLLAGVPALPAAPPLEPCFQALGFTQRPESAEEIKAQYKRLAKVMHPDSGGSEEAFIALTENYEACLRAMEEAQEK
ncbi:J domain-containing protein [Intestinimonas butyriciproducens]|uniref:J domain-containing protein n=1 Tax=Intestinimonas butyriciproducens TaxID=1297617 RepID=UPI0018A1222D|nr:J domain-containing protein [Intestinimonas butyriciproducens]